MNTASGFGDTLSALIAAGLNPLQALWYQFVTYLPAVLAAIIVFLVGWVVAILLGKFIAGILRYSGLDAWVEKRGIRERLRLDIGPGFISLSDTIGSIVKWLMLLASLGVAASIAGLPEITYFVNVVFAYIPNVVVASILLAFGVLAGQYTAEFVVAGVDISRFPVRNRETLGLILKYAIITLAVMAALLQLGIVPELIQILFAGLVFALALAFGLGGREHASDAIRKMREQA